MPSAVEQAVALVVRLAVAAPLIAGASACAARPPVAAGGCPAGMAQVQDGPRRFCIDRYEASLVEIGAGGRETDFSPYETVGQRVVRAVSKAGAVPQGYISRNEAETACGRSKKRLCTEAEWVRACMGASKRQFPYGTSRRPGTCNDRGKAPLTSYYSLPNAASDQWGAMNDPRLNQMSGTVAPTGSHEGCASEDGVFDLMGNLHEWVADREGTFLGGYYLDTKLNGDGCRYKTVAHGPTYHDYSTGFRCCAD